MHIRLLLLAVMVCLNSCAAAAFPDPPAIPLQEFRGTIPVFGGTPPAAYDVPEKRTEPPDYASWVCNEELGYPLFLYAPDALAEVSADGGGGAYYYGRVDPEGSGTFVRFECSDLPGAILLDAVETPVRVRTAIREVPRFAVWTDYSCSLTTNPPCAPDKVASDFSGVPQTLLIKIPAQ